MLGRDVEAKRPRSVLSAAIPVSRCSLSSKTAGNVAAVVVINDDTIALKSGYSERDVRWTFKLDVSCVK